MTDDPQDTRPPAEPARLEVPSFPATVTDGPQADTAEPGILAQNGYAAIRAAMLGVCSSLGGIPREAVAAAIEYNAAAVRRLRLGVGNDPRAAAALEAATREARYLVAVSRMHRDLHDIEERLAAADRIAGR